MKINEYKDGHDIIARAHRRATAKKNNALSGREPEVGIFWLYQGTPILTESIPVSEGTEYGDFVNGPMDHYNMWGVYQRHNILDHYPGLKGTEYDAIPRGRVVYDKSNDTYIIYHGKSAPKTVLKKVPEEFKLPTGKYRYETDMHYDPLPDDFEF